MTVADLQGLWRRSLISWPGRASDTTTSVHWLQAPTGAYIDLRQPTPLPDFSHARALDDLTFEDCTWLARQEGFAGQLTFDGAHFEWIRQIDFQPCSASADAGSLKWEGDVLIETGRDCDYIEHWHRDPAIPTTPADSLDRQHPTQKTPATLLRVGPNFMFARERATRLAKGYRTLAEYVAAATDLAAARALIDCEISFGEIDASGLRITALDPPLQGRRSHGVGIMSLESGKLPVVDVSALFGDDPDAIAATAAEMGKAARAFGFLYVTGHQQSPALFDAVLAAAKRFFAQSADEKMRVYIGNSRNHRGYVPEGEEVFAGGAKDAKEAYDSSRDLPADDPDYLAGNPLLGPNQWPDLPGFKAAVTDYYRATFELGRVLLRGFALALGEEPDLFAPLLTRPPSQLRLIHYPYDDTAADRPGLGAHTDYEFFTMLRSTAPGLEVMNDAGAWIDAPPLPNAYAVNIGDMLELWTNGEFVATSHRVRKVREERYSFPLFFAVDYNTRIAPMPRLVRPGSALRTPLVAGEHLFAQTAQTFGYLRRRLETGELVLPESSLALASFGQQAKLGAAPATAGRRPDPMPALAGNPRQNADPQ